MKKIFKYIYISIITIIDILLLLIFIKYVSPFLTNNLGDYKITINLFRLLILIFYGVILFKQIRFYFNFLKEYNNDQFGSSSFVKRSELKKQYLQVPQEGNFNGKGGFVVSWTQGGQNTSSNKMLVDNSATNMKVIASSRGGKGELVILPTIDNLSRGSEKPSMIIFDKKPELYNLFGEKLKERGYEVKVLNLKDLEMSMGYNPLSLGIEYYFSGKKSKAENEFVSVSENLIPSDDKSDWANMARVLFRSGVLALLEEVEAGNLEKEDLTLFSVYTFLSNMASMNNENENALASYFDQKSPESISRAIFNSINSADSDNIWNSIKVSALPKLEQFRVEDMAKVTSKDTINLLDFGYGEKPIALFIAFPSMNEKLEKLASIYLDQVFTRLDEHTEKTGGKMDRDVYLVLDEIASCRKIDTIGKVLSTGNGKGFRSLVVLQDPSQLEKQYKKSEAEEILENCSVEMYIISNNEKYNEDFSKRVGEFTKQEINRSGAFARDKNFTKNYRSRRLIKPDELIQLELGESIVLRTNYRKDYRGNKIKSEPIANVGKHKMLLRHEYLELEYTNIEDMPFLYDPEIKNISFDDTFKRLKLIFSKYSSSKLNPENFEISIDEDNQSNYQILKLSNMINEVIETYGIIDKFSDINDDDTFNSIEKKIDILIGYEKENPKVNYDLDYVKLKEYYKKIKI